MHQPSESPGDKFRVADNDGPFFGTRAIAWKNRQACPDDLMAISGGRRREQRSHSLFHCRRLCPSVLIVFAELTLMLYIRAPQHQ